MITFLHAGMQSTVQDLGRLGFAAAGVSACGAADAIALRVGNRLLGNPESAAGLEMTLVGACVRFECAAWIAVCGARSLGAWRAQRVEAGAVLDWRALRDGARAYLCVRGGIDVPLVLGSRSTHLGSSLGGYQGRALQAGDRLSFGPEPALPVSTARVEPAAIPSYGATGALRVVDGPQAPYFSPATQELWLASTWQVSNASDRMGLRLVGPSLESPAREWVSEGVLLGAVQVPSHGQPIVNFVDHQSTGGYPKLAQVIRADWARLGQWVPRQSVRFERVSLESAREALRQQEEFLSALG